MPVVLAAESAIAIIGKKRNLLFTKHTCMRRVLLRLVVFLIASSAFTFAKSANSGHGIPLRDSMSQSPAVTIPLRYDEHRDLTEMGLGIESFAFSLEEELDVLATHRLGLQYMLQPLDIATSEDATLDFNHFLLTAAHEFEQRRILYRSIPLSDCSGMFHRLLQEMKDAFPDYRYPEVSEARSSRALAQWYHNQDALTIISDAAKSGSLIKPGAVMFFGQSGKKYTKPTIEQLVIAGVGIQHIGTVVDVEYNEEGELISYTMFHARGKGKIASKTKHYLQRPGNPTLPAFGNWRQQWVAVANIATAPEAQLAAK